MVVLTPEQLSVLASTAEAEDPVLATAGALAALTGARRGELVALRWSDIDMGAGRVVIARLLTMGRGGGSHGCDQDTRKPRAGAGSHRRRSAAPKAGP